LAPAGGTPNAPGIPASARPALCARETLAPSTVRRLTNAEYRQALRDLLGGAAALQAAADLPADSTVGGFDNNAAAQALSAKHLAAYLSVAEQSTAALAVDAKQRAAFFGCQPSGSARAACTRDFIEAFGRRVYRRPLTTAEVSDYVALAALFDGDSDVFAGLDAVTQALLTSTSFLHLIETGTPDRDRPGHVRLTGHELAARLAFLVTGTTPDDKLLETAASGKLDTAEGVTAAARALLATPAAATARRRFLSGWLAVDELANVARDAKKYPRWSEPLRAAMAEETHRFLDGLVAERKPLLDLVTADHGFVNDVLAPVYGAPVPAKGTWARHTFPAGQRGAGYLTQATFLTVAALHESASPIKRGQAVRVSLLCESLPSPPNDVPPLEDQAKAKVASEREHLGQHVSRPECAGCHKLLDPIGFGLANYDDIGAWRTKDSFGAVIDARGEVPGIEASAFEGAAALGKVLRGSPQLSECVATQFLRYALARTDSAEDACSVATITKGFLAGGATFESLVEATVGSDAFRMRRLPTSAPGGER
jgi:hypothetical protein